MSAGTVYRYSPFGRAQVDFWEHHDNQVGQDVVTARAIVLFKKHRRGYAYEGHGRHGKAVYGGWANYDSRSGRQRSSHEQAKEHAISQAIASLRQVASTRLKRRHGRFSARRDLPESIGHHGYAPRESAAERARRVEEAHRRYRARAQHQGEQGPGYDQRRPRRRRATWYRGKRRSRR